MKMDKIGEKQERQNINNSEQESGIEDDKVSPAEGKPIEYSS